MGAIHWCHIMSSSNLSYLTKNRLGIYILQVRVLLHLRHNTPRNLIQRSLGTRNKREALRLARKRMVWMEENELRKEKQLEGIARAKSDGVQFGRKSKLTPERVSEMRQKRFEGVLIKDLMDEYGLSKASVYRLLTD